MINDVAQAIGTYGFPIVACLIMGWYVKYQMDVNNKQIADLTDKHQKEMHEITTALNNNTMALSRLCDKLGGD